MSGQEEDQEKEVGRTQRWRCQVQETLFEGTSRTSRIFDVVVIAAILVSVVAVMLESIPEINAYHGRFLYSVEWVLTAIFTIEYLLRLMCAPSPRAYAGSFYGLIDLLAVIPTYIDLLIPGAHTLLVIRILRLLRIFRILKLVQYWSAGDLLMEALWSSRRKIAIFLTTVFVLVTILGALIYLVEGADNGYDSIPRSVYWAIVTLTTVGYGDISPQTPLGQVLAAVIMLTGYAIIAVPTGIVSTEIALARLPLRVGQKCKRCKESSHRVGAQFCHGCGAALDPVGASTDSPAGSRRL